MAFNELGITQYSDYDPFGLALAGLSGGSSSNRLKYNGKEAISEVGANVYDYGARLYDAQIGRMKNPDALAEAFAEVSPYVYGLNNPLYYTDPTGLSVVPANQVTDANFGSFNTARDEIGLNAVTVKAAGNTQQQDTNTEQGQVIPLPLAPSFQPGPVPTIPPVIGRAGAVGAAFYAGWQLGPPLARQTDGITESIAQILVNLGVDRQVLYEPNVYSYHVPPKELPGFPGATRVPSKNQRARWKTPDGQILEWDYQHGEIEIYNKRGKHEGVANPNTGEVIKDPVPGRKTDN